MAKITVQDIETARARIAANVKVTPLTLSERLQTKFKRKISIKWENKHPTGSFKERGACNFLMALDRSQFDRVYAFSAGNHALAVSYHSSRLAIPCDIVMPRFAPLVKVSTTQSFGANVVQQGDSFDEARSFALEHFGANPRNACLPAFDHELVVSGQGTCGLEILDQSNDCDAIFVPLGGGGLISGIALAIKAKKPKIPVIAVQSEWAQMYRSGTVQPSPFPPATIADGIAVKIPGDITRSIVEKYVDETIVVTETDIADGINQMLAYEHTVCEGAGVAALAALFVDKVPARFKHPLFVMTGSNIDLNLLSRLIERNMARTARLLKVRVSVPDRPGSLNKVTSILAANSGNVIRVIHDRSFCEQPGCVQIGFVMEVQNSDHSERISAALKQAGLAPQEF